MINVNTNFHLGSKLPLDSRQVVETLDDLLDLDTNILYNGIECYVASLDCKYKYHEDYTNEDTGNWKLIDDPISTVEFYTTENWETFFEKLTIDNTDGGGI